MSTTPPPSRDDSGFRIQETRYSLANLIKEVSAERQTGAFGMERLRQSDIRKVIRTKPRQPRAT